MYANENLALCEENRGDGALVLGTWSLVLDEYAQCLEASGGKEGQVATHEGLRPGRPPRCGLTLPSVALITQAMQRPAVFFDRDNTLIVSDGYLGDPSKVVLIPGAAAAIAELRKMGYAIVVVSNQSGVARGMFDETAMRAVSERMSELMLEQNPEALIDAHEYCPHHPDAPLPRYRRDCDCRKPKPGMLLHAAKELNLDLKRSWLIGDAPRDIEAGAAAGCRTVLFEDAGLSASPATKELMRVAPQFAVDSLPAVVDIIRSAGSVL